MKKIFIVLLICNIFFVPACKKANKRSGALNESKIKPVDFLSASKYGSLMVDLVYDQGYAPSPETINNLKNFLAARLNKPGGIQIIKREITGNGKSALTIADLQAIEQKNRTYYSEGSILAAYIYLANSDYADNSGSNKVLGVHYNATSMALFGKTLREFSGGLAKPSYATLETTVAEHELCHVLGLVDNGTAAVSKHMDASHDGHCSNSKCLMYYLAETSGIVDNLLGGVIPQLDEDCIADLRNNGGK